MYIPISDCLYIGLSVCINIVIDRCEKFNIVSLLNAYPPMTPSYNPSTLNLYSPTTLVAGT